MSGGAVSKGKEIHAVERSTDFYGDVDPKKDSRTRADGRRIGVRGKEHRWDKETSLLKICITHCSNYNVQVSSWSCWRAWRELESNNTRRRKLPADAPMPKRKRHHLLATVNNNNERQSSLLLSKWLSRAKSAASQKHRPSRQFRQEQGLPISFFNSFYRKQQQQQEPFKQSRPDGTTKRPLSHQTTTATTAAAAATTSTTTTTRHDDDDDSHKERNCRLTTTTTPKIMPKFGPVRRPANVLLLAQPRKKHAGELLLSSNGETVNGKLRNYCGSGPNVQQQQQQGGNNNNNNDDDFPVSIVDQESVVVQPQRRRTLEAKRHGRSEARAIEAKRCCRTRFKNPLVHHSVFDDDDDDSLPAESRPDDSSQQKQQRRRRAGGVTGGAPQPKPSNSTSTRNNSGLAAAATNNNNEPVIIGDTPANYYERRRHPATMPTTTTTIASNSPPPRAAAVDIPDHYLTLEHTPERRRLQQQQHHNQNTAVTPTRQQRPLLRDASSDDDDDPLYTKEEFKTMWRAAETDIGHTTEEIESGSLVRGANSEIRTEDSSGQKKAPYGRILPDAVDYIFSSSILDLQRNDVFVDIGHGLGNTVLQAAYTIGCESRGIEVVNERNMVAGIFEANLKGQRRLHRELHNRETPVGKVRFRHGRLEEPCHRKFLTTRHDENSSNDQQQQYTDEGGAMKVLVNNYNAVFADRCALPGQTHYYLDQFVAGLFALMKPGSKLLTLHPLDMPPSLQQAQAERRKHNLPLDDTSNASFFEFRKVSIGRANQAVSWSQNGTKDDPIEAYLYTRVGSATILCGNRVCRNAREAVPIPATQTVAIAVPGRVRPELCVLLSCCQKCRVSSKVTRVRKKVNYKA